MNFDKAVNFKAFLDRTVDADLIALGFTQAEVSTLKSGFADLDYMKVNSFDSSMHVKQMYGTGTNQW